MVQASRYDLEERLEENPWDRQAYLDLIMMLRMGGELDDCGRIRLAYASKFILPQRFLLEWIADLQVIPNEGIFMNVAGLCIETPYPKCLEEVLKAAVALNHPRLGEIMEACCEVAQHDYIFGHAALVYCLDHTGSQEAKQKLVNLLASGPFVAQDEIREHIGDLLTDKGNNERFQWECKLAENFKYRPFWITFMDHWASSPDVASIYARYLTYFPDDLVVWCKYLDHTQQGARRFVKACPLKADSWIRACLAAEQVNLPDVLGVLPHLDGAEEQLRLAFECLNYICRIYPAGQSDAFIQASFELIQACPSGGNHLLRKLARLCAARQMVHDALDIYESCVDAFGKDQYFWIEYCKACADPSHMLGLFQRAAGQIEGPCDKFVAVWLEAASVYPQLAPYPQVHREARALLAKNMPAAAEKRPRPSETDAPEVKKRRRAEESLQVELAPTDKTKTIFVNNIDFSVKDSQLKEFFVQNAGKIAAFQMGKNEKGQSKGFASIQFEDGASVSKALALDRSRVNGRPLFISMYRAPGSLDWKPKEVDGRNDRVVFVSKLPETATEELVAGLFPAASQIRLGLHKDGKCKGFAYVEFASEADAKAALNVAGTVVAGRPVSVLISDPSLAPKRQHQKTQMVPAALSKGRLALNRPPKEQDRPEEEPRSNDDFRRMLGLE